MSRYVGRTIIRPLNYSVRHSLRKLNIKPRSLLLLNTPQVNISNHINEVVATHPEIQIINATLDSNHKSSISELWLSSRVRILSLKEHVDNTSSKNWTIETAKLDISFQNHKASLEISNSTIFYTGLPFSMSVIDQTLPDQSNKNLSHLSLELPFALTLKTHHTNLIPLKAPQLTVTKSGGNLILEINGTSASSFLMESLHNAVGQRSVKVFARIHNRLRNRYNTYEVIAGGGEWGPRSSALVLEGFDGISIDEPYPEIEFFYVPDTNELKLADYANGFYFENVLEDYDGKPQDHTENKESDLIKEDLFGLGSIKGFEFDDVNYKSAGESLVLQQINSSSE